MKLRIKHAQQLLAEAAQRYANDEHARLNHFLKNFPFEASIGRRRYVSEKRQTEIGNILHLCLRELKEMRLPVMCLSQLKRKSGLKLVKKWQERGLAVGTIEDRISVLRKFLDLVDRGSVLPRGQEWRVARKHAGLAVRSADRPSSIRDWRASLTSTAVPADDTVVPAPWSDLAVGRSPLNVPVEVAPRSATAEPSSAKSLAAAAGGRRNRPIRPISTSTRSGVSSLCSSAMNSDVRRTPSARAFKILRLTLTLCLRSNSGMSGL